MSAKKKHIKIILAKTGLDGHDRGIDTVAKWLRDAGMEVVYLGRFFTAEEVAAIAIQESADVIGLSFLAGDHLLQVDKILKNMKERDFVIPLIIGGIIPDRDIPKLKEMGVSAIFPPGTPLKQILQDIEKVCNGKSSKRDG